MLVLFPLVSDKGANFRMVTSPEDVLVLISAAFASAVPKLSTTLLWPKKNERMGTGSTTMHIDSANQSKL